MENALRACCKGIKIGKILIHREGDNGQQVSMKLVVILSCFQIHISDVLTCVQLIYEKLPKDISDRHVLLLDPILGTGWAVKIISFLCSGFLSMWFTSEVIFPLYQLL